MSKVARRLLSKRHEVPDVLRVVFTPVNKVPRDKGPTRKNTESKRDRASSGAPARQPPTRTSAIKKPSRDRGKTSVKLETNGTEPRKKLSKKSNLWTDDTRKSPSKSRKARVTQPHGVVQRPEVVNELLLDDVLQYLAPTLEQYKGCTIIDIYPGSCLWTRKVHDFLKPKCHLLLEPDAQYQSHIDSLVGVQDSNYKHIPSAGAIDQSYEDTYKRIFAEDGPLPPSASEDIATLDTNRSILVIGSLNRRNDLKFHGRLYSGSLSSLWHLSEGALVNNLMHLRGPVRMLLWTPEQDRVQFLPERSLYRTHTEASTNVAMHVQAVVAVDSVLSRTYSNEWSVRSRWAGLSVERENIVQNTMRKLGMRVPEGRQIFRHLPPHQLDQAPQGSGDSPYQVRYNTREEVEEALVDLVHHWNTRATSQHPVGPSETSDPTWRHKRRRPEEMYQYLAFPRLADALLEDPTKSFKAAARQRFRLEHGILPGSVSKTVAHKSARAESQGVRTDMTGVDVRTVFFADAALRGINLEMHCKILEEQGVDVADLKKRVMEFGDQVVEYVLRRREVYETDFSRLIDDWTTFFATPPLLTLDQRQYEPLQASSTDFRPEQNLTLLDLTPTNRDLAVPGLADRRRATHACISIIKFLYAQKSQSVTSVLERLAPNASTDLLKLVPSITDPRKGGRLDPKHLKVRLLTSEMLEELTKAWFEWPFRPEGWELDMGVGDMSQSDDRVPLTPDAVTAVDESEPVY